jgi:hypothetical protein
MSLYDAFFGFPRGRRPHPIYMKDHGPIEGNSNPIESIIVYFSLISLLNPRCFSSVDLHDRRWRAKAH